jgi:hypothetical protein
MVPRPRTPLSPPEEEANRRRRESARKRLLRDRKRRREDEENEAHEQALRWEGTLFVGWYDSWDLSDSH